VVAYRNERIREERDILTSGFGPMSNNNNSVRFDVVLRDDFRFLYYYCYTMRLIGKQLLLIRYHSLVIDTIIAY